MYYNKTKIILKAIFNVRINPDQNIYIQYFASAWKANHASLMHDLGLLFTLILILATQNAYSQFQIIPELGVDNNSMAHLVIADSNQFYVIGEQVDTSVEGFRDGIWPYSSVYDYKGILIDHNIIIDSTYQKPFINDQDPIVSFKEDLYFYSVYRNIDSLYLQPFIYLIDVTSGEIIEGTHIPPPSNIN